MITVIRPDVKCEAYNKNFKELPHMWCCVYIIEFDNGVFKIGRASFLKVRLSAYITKLRKEGLKSFIVRYVIKTEGTEYNGLEREFLKLNSKYQIHGEYMSALSNELLEYISFLDGKEEWEARKGAKHVD